MRIKFIVLFAAVCVACGLVFGGCSTKNTSTVPGPGTAYSGKNFVLIVPDGMHVNNEIQASQYLFGTRKGLSFHSWPYQGYLSTWDVTTYDRYAWELNENQVHGTSQAGSFAQFDASNFDPTVGYDPSIGGTAPREGGPGPEDWYFIDGLPYWGETPADGTKEPATDSASAATAFATGYKTDAGNVAWLPGDPPGGSLSTILELFRDQRGGAIGAASTVQFSHATPACFASHNVNRGNYGEIAAEIATEVRPDFVVGAGHPQFTMRDGAPTDRYCPTDVYNALQSDSEYVFVERQSGVNGGAALQAAAEEALTGDGMVFGLFGGPGGNFETPQPVDSPGSPQVNYEEENPSLAEIATAGLTLLSANPNGFCLVLEQGDLDWTNHANDYAGGVGCTHDTHMTAQAVVDWINQPGDDITLDNTIVCVLPDHTHYIRQNEWPGIGELPAQEPIAGEPEPYEGAYRYPDGEPYYHSNNHTNELGCIYAIGGGNEGQALFSQYEGRLYPGTRIIDNTDIFSIMADWLGVN